MDFINQYKIIVLVGMLLVGVWVGSALKQAAWDRADKAALVLQAELDAQSDAERQVLNEFNLQLQLDLEQAERNTERMSNEIQDAINRASVVKTFTVKTPQDCPVLRCNIVDTAEHYRLFNCAVRNSCQTVSPSGVTRLSDASLRRASSVAGVDGAGRYYNEDRSF